MKDALYLLNSYEKTKELSLLEKLQAIKEAFLDQNVSIEYKGKKVDFFKDIEKTILLIEKIKENSNYALMYVDERLVIVDTTSDIWEVI